MMLHFVQVSAGEVSRSSNNRSTYHLHPGAVPCIFHCLPLQCLSKRPPASQLQAICMCSNLPLQGKGRLAAVAPQLLGLAASVVISTIYLAMRGRGGGSGGSGGGDSGGGGSGGSAGDSSGASGNGTRQVCTDRVGPKGPYALLRPKDSKSAASHPLSCVFHAFRKRFRRSAHAKQDFLAQVAGDERKRKPAETGKKLPTVSLTLVSFAVTRKAYERITARFAQQYEAETGQAVRFRLSFGGSGTQVRFKFEIVISTNIIKIVAIQLSTVEESRGHAQGVRKDHARFAREYEAATGQPVRFRLSFGGSGTQARLRLQIIVLDLSLLATSLLHGQLHFCTRSSVATTLAINRSLCAGGRRHSRPFSGHCNATFVRVKFLQQHAWIVLGDPYSLPRTTVTAA